MNVSIIGTGYVGLVSGVCLAEKGHNIKCVDINNEKVDQINSGISPIHEKQLDLLLKKHIGHKFSATNNLEKAVRESDISIIAVGTPFDGDEIDLRFIRQVSEDIGRVFQKLDRYHVVVVKSTVVPGTTDDIVLPLLENHSGKKAGEDFGVGMNPEFLREGEAVNDFMFPDRIVLGCMDNRTKEVMKGLYEVFQDVDKIFCNNRTAEMIKYTANSLLATLISFSNEIGNFCASMEGVDVVDVMKGVHLDKRFSPMLENGTRIKPGFLSYLEAGCGFGGSCFPKDVKALISHAREAGSPMPILESVIKTNEDQPGKIISMVEEKFINLEEIKIAILGLAFKPGTDDMRESPSIPVIRHLLSKKADIRAYDPVALCEAKKIFGDTNITYFNDLSETIKGAEVVIILTKWKEFECLPEKLILLNKQPMIIDGRRMIDKTLVPNYHGIGIKNKSENEIIFLE